MNWGWLTPIVIPVFLVIQGVMYVKERVIRGSIHWNETSQETYDRIGKPCHCRVHKGKVYKVRTIFNGDEPE
jgi:hypothetical protein